MNYTMDDVRGLFLGMPHGTTPAAVTTNKNIIMSSFRSSGDIQRKDGGPDSCFDNQSSNHKYDSRGTMRVILICDETDNSLTDFRLVYIYTQNFIISRNSNINIIVS